MWEDILTDASDYIGNHPEQFGATNADLRDIRLNASFRADVKSAVEDDPEEHEDMTQEEAANFVWGLFRAWAYGEN